MSAKAELLRRLRESASGSRRLAHEIVLEQLEQAYRQRPDSPMADVARLALVERLCLQLAEMELASEHELSIAQELHEFATGHSKHPCFLGPASDFVVALTEGRFAESALSHARRLAEHFSD